MNKCFYIVIILFFAYYVSAQELQTIELGNVDVVAEQAPSTGTEITQEYMQKMNIQNLQQALNYIPGVNLSDSGSRGGASFSIRGFDSSYIPIVVDGISVTNPFNGRSDSGSLLTGDMERIIVQKGYSTMLTGANGLGGAIMLTTAKPKKSFELYIRDSIAFDNIFSKSSNTIITSVGTRQDKFYVKGTVQYIDTDHTRLPDSYTPVSGSLQQKGERVFSDNKDLKTTIIAGITPIQELDIWTTYVYQDSDRGMEPPKIGRQYMLSGWGDWTHHSISLHSNYKTSKWNMALITFYDTYNNTLNSYSSLTHMEYGKPNRITEYDEYAYGANVNIGYTINDQHSLLGAVSFRQDDHWGYRNDLVNRDDLHVRENKISTALEYGFKPIEKLRFIASAGFDSLLPDTFWSRAEAFAEYMGRKEYVVNEKDKWLLSAQAGVFYQPFDHHEIRFTYARKNQYATMNERYSSRLNDSMPNPNLKPEIADHFELGYTGTFFYKLLIETALYYSRITDKMADLKVPDPADSSHSVDFTTNVDSTAFYGMELSSSFFISSFLEAGINLSLSDYSIEKNIANDKTISYYPKTTANAYIDIHPWKDYISIRPVMEYRSKRWADTQGVNSLAAYYLYHIYLASNITNYFSIDASVQNIADKYYELRQGYPQSGRTYSLGASLKF